MREIVLPDGSRILGRGRTEPLPVRSAASPDLGLYLGHERRGESLGAWPLTWLAWRDFSTPADPDAAVEALVAHGDRARAGDLVEITCRGGRGRTGTAIACLVTLSGLDPASAVDWVRERYDPRAVETRSQRRWVAWFADRATRDPEG